MKINLKVRIKNPWFWVGIGAVILTAMGIDPSIFTSWDVVWTTVVNLFTNPFQLFTVAFAVLAIFIDPTTAGISDSEQVMSYTKPKK